jgi:hypothetical protein
MPSSVVDQETETRRASIRQACALELDQEMAKLRARKQSELEKSIDELSTEMMDDIERRAVARVAEVDRQIADREKQGLADLERALGGKKAELQTLSEQQNHATETVERWTSVASALGTGADSVAVARRGEKQCSSYLGRFAPCLGNRAPRTKTRDGWPAFPDHTHSGEPATVRAAPFRIREYYCTPPLLVGWERGCCAAERSG